MFKSKKKHKIYDIPWTPVRFCEWYEKCSYCWLQVVSICLFVWITSFFLFVCLLQVVLIYVVNRFHWISQTKNTNQIELEALKCSSIYAFEFQSVRQSFWSFNSFKFRFLLASESQFGVSIFRVLRLLIELVVNFWTQTCFLGQKKRIINKRTIKNWIEANMSMSKIKNTIKMYSQEKKKKTKRKILKNESISLRWWPRSGTLKIVASYQRK